MRRRANELPLFNGKGTAMNTSRRWAVLGLLSVGLSACGQTRANNQDPDSPDYSGEAGEDMYHPGCDSTASSVTQSCSGDH